MGDAAISSLLMSMSMPPLLDYSSNSSQQGHTPMPAHGTAATRSSPGSGLGHGISTSPSAETSMTRTPAAILPKLVSSSIGKHARGRSFACDRCPARYPHAKSLRDHKQSKHLNKRYTCNFAGCRVSVAHKKNMNRHIETRHRSLAAQGQGVVPSGTSLLDYPST